MLKARGAEPYQNACGVVNEQKNILVSSVFPRVLSELIQSVYPQTRVSSFPGLISVAWVNKWRTIDVTGVLKAPGAELCQNACGVVNEQKNIRF